MTSDIFYDQLEPSVREWVKILRNVGINTECSCEHEGYIQCQSLDPSTEIEMIRKAFQENNLFDYTITITHKQRKEGYSDWNQIMIIESPVFKEVIE